MTNTHLRLTSLIRGMYGRVARKLGVDPSYVSRVARGERRSKEIEALLNLEVSKVLMNALPKAKIKKK